MADASSPSAGDQVRPRLSSDGARFSVATAIATLLVAGYAVIARTLAPDEEMTLSFVGQVYFGAWTSFALAYTLLTWWALRTADGSTLQSWLSETRTGRSRRRRVESLVGTGGPAGAVSFCLLALAAVVGVASRPDLQRDAAVTILTGTVVITTWLLIVTVFAVHYARENAQLGGLSFRTLDRSDDTDALRESADSAGGTNPATAAAAQANEQVGGLPRFADYLYLSVQISVAYTSADVRVSGRSIRRGMTAHTLVAFVFNTVLVALLVTLITTNA